MRVTPAPANPPSSGATPVDSFKSTYNDVQKPDQADTNSGAGDPNTKTVKTARERKEAKDPASDANNPVIADVAPQPRQPVPPLLLFSFPALGEIAPPSDGSESKDGAALSPPPASSTSNRVGAGLAPETLDLPGLSSATQRLPNQELAFALRLSGQESTASGSLPATAVSAVPVTASAKPVQTSLVPTRALEVQPDVQTELPAPSDSRPDAVVAVEPLSTVEASDRTLEGPSLPSVPSRQGLSSDPALPAPKTQNTASAGPMQTTSTPINSPKIATPVKQSSGNGNSGVNSERPAEPAPGQRSVELRNSNTPTEVKYSNTPTEVKYSNTLTEVREFSSAVNSGTNAAETKPLDTRIEAPAPLTSAAQPSTPVNEISLRVNGADQSSAAIRVLDRSGEIRVSVHASDPQLANTLRSDVDELRSHLATRGWDADVWKPEGGSTSVTPASVNNGRSESQNQDNSAGRRDGQPQQQSRQQQNQSEKRPEWMDELEASVVKGAA